MLEDFATEGTDRKDVFFYQVNESLLIHLSTLWQSIGCLFYLRFSSDSEKEISIRVTRLCKIKASANLLLHCIKMVQVINALYFSYQNNFIGPLNTKINQS